jgi:predicted RecB family nuclease
MHVDADRLRLSPSDLSSFLGCRHRTGLDLAVARRVLHKPDWNDPAAQALRDRGAAHERAYVASLRARGLDVVEIDQALTAEQRVAASLDAMRAGAGVIAQAALQDADWMGYADILHRIDEASALGGWSYEPFDTKLSRETRGGTILQLATYVDLLAYVQRPCGPSGRR